uniref:Protein kinase domain-containing protein n=1 Tax=Fundulus heteroclitus TaxID=8078 RepID=A0A3Q2SSJ3_FUNHE
MQSTGFPYIGTFLTNLYNLTHYKTYMAKFVKVRGADQAIIKKEIATLNLARHTNFLLLHESFESPEELVLIYDFISGHDIFERLNSAEFELNEREIVNYIRQICSALEYMHTQRYGHFDIRPENVVYTTRTSSTVKIIELGQSRHLTPGEIIKLQYTTAEYAAPEIHQCDMVSTVTDMWSVGVLAYVLISGLNPFTEPTKMTIVEQRASTEDAMSMQKSFLASSVHMEAASMQASSYSSSTHSAAGQFSFESMSATSMSAMKAESVVSLNVVVFLVNLECKRKHQTCFVSVFYNQQVSYLVLYPRSSLKIKE